MNRNDLYKSFTEVNDDALLRTESRHTRRRIRSRMSFIAASLALVLCLFGISFLFNPNRSKDNNFSWFVITAYAADVDLEELGLNDGHFYSDSIGEGEPLFGEDTPLFRFTVKPANWEDNQAAYSRFVVTVSRDGKILDSLDDHVLVMHKLPVSGSAGSYECEVVGWLEEDANIIITISDKETGALIEEQTVNVRYSADSQAYQLTVTNVQTNELEK